VETAIFLAEMLGIGAGVGLISNVLGLGGGIIMVPAFYEFVDGMDMNTAKGTSLLVIMFVTAVNSWRLNIGRKHVPWKLAGTLAIGSLVGGFLGGWITGLLPNTVVVWIFIAFMIVVGLRTFVIEPKPFPESKREGEGRRPWVAAVIGLVTGLVSGATGTGGGAILVPLVLMAGLTDNRRVVALSNMVMVVTCASGVAAHMVSEQTTNLPYTIGQVHLPLVPFVFIGAMAIGPLGRFMNRRMSIFWRRTLLGGLLLIIAVRLIIRALSG